MLPISDPLANRVRPNSLASFVGQEHLVGPGKPLFQVLQTGRIHSMILWGPPGVGKTTLARILAREANRPFHELSAVSAGKEQLRQIVDEVRKTKHVGGLFSEAPGETDTPVLFLDEIHRFNKAQQDFLLPYVEDGTIILIGATTENPSFEVIAALLSRCRVYTLKELTAENMREIVSRGAGEIGVELAPAALDFLIAYSGGDARQALNLLQGTSELYEGQVTDENIKNALQSRHLRYDKQAEEHYNTISAFIKSMRASNPDAALHYLARMVHAGEDPKFIARRMVIFASEDVGIADPNALNMANNVFRAVETIGYPECKLNLAHGVVYLALAPKDRSCNDAIGRALEDVEQFGSLPIPMKLRNAPTKLMKELGYGKDEDPQGHGSLLPEEIKDRRYFTPNEQP